MPFDSSGTFNRVIPGGWKADASAGIKITAVRHDSEDDGFAAGLSTCITKDGRTQPTANLPMNGKKLINLGEPVDPEDAATKNYVDTFKSFTTGANISGAGPINGFINFTSPTGINGIGWTTADMSWVGKLEKVNETSKRLTVNDRKDGTGTDVCIVDEAGRINNSGWLTNNMSWDGAAWRTILAGVGTMVTYASGSFGVWLNDTATVVDYQTMTPRRAWGVDCGGSTTMILDKLVNTECFITSQVSGVPRWRMFMGNSTTESGSRTGCDFYLQGFDNGGVNAVNEISISRETHTLVTAGSITAGATVTASSGIFTSPGGAILAATNNTIHLRPYGAGVGSYEASLDVGGNWTLSNGGNYAGLGIRCKNGMNGGYTSNWHNMIWSSPYVYVHIDDTNMGAIAWQSDYRMKKDIVPLPSMWDAVKRLSPIQYSIRDWGLFKNDDTPRWGFVAHDLQDKLLESAATGHKDEENVVQSPNPWTLLAAVTKALQEAMRRIEVLEAKA